MKFTLINPPRSYLVNPDLRAPLGFLYLASVLENREIEVNILNLSSKSVENSIIPESKIYGITSTSVDIKCINSLSAKIKELYPHSTIIVGGPGAYSKEYLDYSVVDSTIMGEVEHRIDELLYDLNNNILKKEYNFGVCPNINSIPLPARHLYNMKLPLNIITSRGCSFNCSFCMSPLLYNHRVRFRDNNLVIEEIESLIDTYNTRYFIFEDDMFTLNKKRLLDICAKLSRLNITWRGMARVKPLDEEMLESMKKSGCDEIALGIESFDDNVLKCLNKGTTVKDNVRAIDLLNKFDIKLRLLLMIRTPGQTSNTMKLNKEYLSKVKYSTIACTNFTPIVGSDIWNNSSKYNINLFNKNINDYNYGLFDSKGLSELKSIFSINNRTLEEFHNETIEFREWLLNKEGVNKG